VKIKEFPIAKNGVTNKTHPNIRSRYGPYHKHQGMHSAMFIPNPAPQTYMVFQPTQVK